MSSQARLGLAELKLGDFGCDSVPDKVKEALLKILKQTTPGWERCDCPTKSNEFNAQRLTGALSNMVFRCSKSGGDHPVVLVRSYGEAGEAFVNRNVEIELFRHLAQQGLGPGLLAEFGDGRVEKWLEAKALTSSAMREPPMSALIAAQMADLHRATLDELPMGRDPMLFDTMHKYHKCARELCGDTYGGVEMDQLEFDIKRIVKRLKQRPSPAVFSHNDLQYGNIMYSQGDDHVVLIDYEYSGPNFRGYDIGNHFCEWMADYHGDIPHLMALNKFPNQDEQRHFCRAYLLEASHKQEGSQGGQGNGGFTEPDVDSLVEEALEYSLASHLLWACWGLAQSKLHTEAAFDYLEYARERLSAFKHFEKVMGP